MPRTPADDEMIDRVLEREGGFVDDPLDRGGATNKGITMETLKGYLGHTPSLAELRDLTTEMARNIYFDLYMVRPGFSEIRDPALRELLFDAGVNHGPSNAVRQLQRALNKPGAPVLVDGVLGPQTRQAVEEADQRALVLKTFAQRLRFYGNIMVRNPEQKRFAAGWINRLADVADALA